MCTMYITYLGQGQLFNKVPTCAYGIKLPVLGHIPEILRGFRGCWLASGLASSLFSHVRPAPRPALALSLQPLGGRGEGSGGHTTSRASNFAVGHTKEEERGLQAICSLFSQ